MAWRDLQLQLPTGWQAYEQRDDLLYMADGLPGEDGVRGDLEVAAQFTFEPNTVSDDWREFVEQQGGTMEVDEAVNIGGVPGTRFVFSYVTNDVPLREMVVVLPSRGVVGLLQAVPVAGQKDAPDVFLRRADEFNAILDSIDFGAPLDFLDREDS